MKRSELSIMNRSFSILNRRRAKLLKKPSTFMLKEKVQKIREYSVAHLDELVELAIQNLEENEVEVIRAKDGHEAREAIYQIIKDEPMVAKSKSNTAGEILLTEHLESQGVQVLETDLGDRIVQLHHETPSSHPIGPAAHLDIETIAKIIGTSLNKQVKAEPHSIQDTVKGDILKKLVDIKVGITGANSVAAQDGSLLMVHNEGNISLLTLMDVHIVLVGIDKMVPTLEDAISVVKLETIYATGKTVPAYMNVISSPSKTADIEQIILKDMYGAKRVVVILLDNGRSEALKEGEESLWCIGCGACIINCPVYTTLGPDFGYLRHLGGRGVVISRYLNDEQACFDSGLFKCTLCGLCTPQCPVNIPTNDMLENLRKESVKEGIFPEKHSEIKNNIKKNNSPYLL